MSTAATPPISLGDLHDDHVIALLRTGAHATLLSAYFGELEYRQLCQLAKLAVTRHIPTGPLVFILPGVMGSRLANVQRKSSSLLWLHPHAVCSGSLQQLALPGSRSLRAIGVMLPGYLKLKLTLEVAGFRAVFCPFDWRLDINRLARAFMKTVEHADAEQVLVVGHSMGGLVARAALGLDHDRRITKLVQLGAPNGGSFAPLQAMRAVYPTVRKIAALDQLHTAEQLAKMVFRTLPGLYQMLPGPEHGGGPNLFDATQWPDDDLNPEPRLLKQARKTREQLPAADDRCFGIVGMDQPTITTIAPRDNAFEYTLSRDGDGTVPRRLAVWPQAKTWYVGENHGALANNDGVLAALVDVLKTGATERLSASPLGLSSTATHTVTDKELRAFATHKVAWDALSLDSRRRILEPTLSPEFLVSS